jgi:enterobacteria phage integrase
MPRKLFPYVEKHRTRHGRLLFYFRRGKGARIRLPDNPGSPEFLEAYAAALAGNVPAPGQPHARVRLEPAGTIGALIVDYKRSIAYQGLRASTRADYAFRLEKIRVMHGRRSLRGLTRENILTRILDPIADRPGAYRTVFRMLRVLVRHGIERRLIDHDPTPGIRMPKMKEIRSWTDAELAQFEARWPVGSRERLAYSLHLYTGQRRSDVIKMTWADIGRDGIAVTQLKTGHKLIVPVHPELQTVLAATPRRNFSILTTAHGGAFSIRHYAQWFRAAIRLAGLPLECSPHGLRKTAGRRLAEAGCPAKEIMAVLGHRTMAEAERYTRDADQLKLASAAIIRLTGRKSNEFPQTEKNRVGKIPKKERKPKC